MEDTVGFMRMEEKKGFMRKDDKKLFKDWIRKEVHIL
jgi:hypothetical protein